MKIKEATLLEMSVRSKFAFGLCCVEKAIEKYVEMEPVLQEVIDKAWEFTCLPILDSWEDEIKELMPWGILDPYEKVLEEKKFITFEKGRQLKELYLKIPQFILEMLDNTIFIGLSNLYVDVIKNSGETLKLLISIIQLCKQNNISVPDTSLFLKSKITEDNGWGKEHSRSFYVS